MAKRSKLTLLVGALLIVGVFLFLGIPQAKALNLKDPYKIWHDRIFLGQLEMEKDVEMKAGLFLQGALINGTTGGDPVVVGDHLRVDGILFANNIIVRGASGGEPVIIGDHLRIDGDIFNPYNSVRIKDDLRVSYSSQFLGKVETQKGLAVTGGDLTVGNAVKFKVEYKTGETTISGPLTVTDTSSLKDLTVSNSASLASLSTSGLATLDSLNVTRSSTFSNSVNIQGNATFTKNVTLGNAAGDTIAVGGTASFSNPISGSLSTAGNFSVGGNLSVTGTSVCGTISFNDLTVNNDLTVDDDTTLGNASGDAITVRGTPTFFTHLNVQDDALASVFQGDLTVNGTLTAPGISITGTSNDTFTINSDNASNDTEDEELVFHRGIASPHAIIKWDSGNDEFNFNQKINAQGIFYVDLGGNAGGYAGKEAALVGDLKVTGNIDPVDILYSGGITQAGGGTLNTFTGNVDATAGLDVTGANLTVGTLTVVPGTGTVSAGTWQGTAIVDAYIASAATWNAKMTNPMTTLGDIIYGAAAGTPTRLAGSAGFLKSTGAAIPTWSALVAGDIPDISGTYLALAGGTMAGLLTTDAVTVPDTKVFAFNMAGGTSPFTVASSTVVTNLNADLLDGNDSTAFMGAGIDNWVNTVGDTMTGDLNLNGANITMAGAETVDGIDISTIPATYVDVAGDTMTGALTVNNSATLGDGGDTITIGTVTDDVAITDANWSITGAGAATLASIDASSGGITNAGAITGATTITASGLIQSTAGNIQGVSGVFSTDVQTPTLTANTAVNNNIVINAAAGTAGTVDIGTGTATGLITIGNNGVNTVTVAPALTASNGITVTTGGIGITAGGLQVTAGGIDVNSTGITNAGSITGVGTNITAAAGLAITTTGATALGIDTGAAAAINIGATANAVNITPATNITGLLTASGGITMGAGTTLTVGAGETLDVTGATITGLNASSVVNTPAGNIAATDVQAAINELDTEKLALAGGNMTGNLQFSGAGSNAGVGLVNAPAQVSAAATDLLTVGTDNQVQRYDFAAGAGAYTYNIDLDAVSAYEGAVFYIYINKAASANPTINVRDGSGGANIISLNNANAEDYGCIFIYDGTNWQKHIVAKNDL